MVAPYKRACPGEVAMTDFLISQLFGLNGLVNLSNLMFLLAFSVRSVLKLRILSVVSYVVILPYYYFQQQTLWPPIFWGVAFILVNGIRITMLLLERRSVVLNPSEAELYKLAFSSIDQRDFLKLGSLARWVDCPAGQVLINKGQTVTQAMIMVRGEIEASLGDGSKVALHPGQLIGTGIAFSGLPSPADIVVVSPARVVSWNLALLRKFLEPRPELRSKLLQITSADLVSKLNQLAAIGRSVV